jgi:hypothetical protein
MAANPPERPTVCPSCGKVYDPTRTTYCNVCGNRFPWAGGSESQFAVRTGAGADAARMLLAFGAALLFVIAGLQMVGLQSISGDTVAEAFYNDMGWFSFGMAALAAVFGVPRPEAKAEERPAQPKNVRD